MPQSVVRPRPSCCPSFFFALSTVSLYLLFGDRLPERAFLFDFTTLTVEIAVGEIGLFDLPLLPVLICFFPMLRVGLLLPTLLVASSVSG